MSDKVITRNGISKTLAKNVFGKKSPNAGKAFPAPVLNEPKVVEGVTLPDGTANQRVLVNIDDLLWTGLQDITMMVNKNLRKIFGDIYLDNIYQKDSATMPTPADHPELEGTLNEANYDIEAADFSAGVEKLGDIEDKLEDLYALQQSYAMDEQFGEENEDGSKTDRAKELDTLIKKTAEEIKPLRIQKEVLKAKWAARAQQREETKAKKEAAAAAAKLAALNVA